MANLDAPNGLVPVRHLKGGTIRYDGKYTIASALGEDIFLGDPVALTGSGTNIRQAVGGPTTPDTDILGVFAGCRYVAANGDVVWAKQWVSGTVTLGSADAEAFVYTDPDVIYSIQLAGSITAADIGQLADFLDSTQANGNAATGVSGVELEAVFTGGTQFKIHRLAAAPDGIFEADIASANPRLEVSIVGTQLDIAS